MQCIHTGIVRYIEQIRYFQANCSLHRTDPILPKQNFEFFVILATVKPSLGLTLSARKIYK